MKSWQVCCYSVDAIHGSFSNGDSSSTSDKRLFPQFFHRILKLDC